VADTTVDRMHAVVFYVMCIGISEVQCTAVRLAVWHDSAHVTYITNITNM